MRKKDNSYSRKTDVICIVLGWATIFVLKKFIPTLLRWKKRIFNGGLNSKRPLRMPATEWPHPLRAAGLDCVTRWASQQVSTARCSGREEGTEADCRGGKTSKKRHGCMPSSGREFAANCTKFARQQKSLRRPPVQVGSIACNVSCREFRANGTRLLAWCGWVV